jgi:SAM-dependent methyltransferase
VKKVYAIDVSEHIMKNEAFAENLELIISDGCSIPVPENSINVAYSDQLMEHLHPDDAHQQLQNIYKALSPDGIYICITPNRLHGPHDVSKYFDNIATGFHIKEYTVTELCDLFRRVGFIDINSYIGGKGIYIKFPLFITKLIEKFLSLLKFPLRRKIAYTLIFRKLLNVVIVGKKLMENKKVPISTQSLNDSGKEYSHFPDTS